MTRISNFFTDSFRFVSVKPITVNMVNESSKDQATATRSATNLDRVVKAALDEVVNSSDFLEKLVGAIAKRVTDMVLKELEKSISFNIDAVEDLKKKLEVKEQEQKRMREDLNAKCDELEQYSRRNNVRIFGVPESSNENCDELVLNVCKAVGADITVRDIDRCHRVGPKSPGKTRPIIVKLTSYRYRQQIFINKRKLKGSSTTIREDLTTTRLAILKAAIERFGLFNCWSHEGDIIIKKPDGSKIRVRRLSELHSA